MIELKILHPGQPGPSDHHLAKLAEFMGVAVSFVPAPAGVADGVDGVLLAGGVEAIGILLKNPNALDRAKAVFVYGIRQDRACVEVLSKLTNGAVTGVAFARDNSQRVDFPAGSEDVMFQFSGLGQQYPAEGRHATLVTGSSGAVRSLISLDGAPFFAESKHHGVDVLLTGSPEITDMDDRFLKGQPVMQQFKSFIPAMAFLRKHAAGQCWHPSSYQATLVIDDPLVRPRYGHVNFAELLQGMERRNFATTLAFIPWNYRRSDQKTAELFRRQRNRLSLAVHGCDHNASEFGVTDEAQLNWKGRTALERMDRHRQTFQAGFDKVMVYPQGIFSAASVAALQRCGFEAAANATPHPVDKPGDYLLMRDMMEAALTKFSNFPIFLRRSHHSVPIAAFDLFLGRPAVFFTHHEDFHDHGKQIGDLAERINALPGPVRWRTLGEVCARATLQRFDHAGNLHVRAYTDRFVFQNPTEAAQSCFFHRAAGDVPVRRALVNGKPIETAMDGGYIKAPFALEPGGAVEVKLERETPAVLPNGYHQTLADKASIFFRRHLSEFRANYMAGK